MYKALFVILVCFLVSCNITGTSNGTPQFIGDISAVENNIIQATKSQSIEFVEVIVQEGDDVIKRLLRVDLIKPGLFPDKEMAKQILNIVRTKLNDAAEFTHFDINGISKKTSVFPSENVAQTISVDLKDLY